MEKAAGCIENVKLTKVNTLNSELLSELYSRSSKGKGVLKCGYRHLK